MTTTLTVETTTLTVETTTADFPCAQADLWLPPCDNRVTVEGALCPKCAHDLACVTLDGASRTYSCTCGAEFTCGDPGQDLSGMDVQRRHAIGAANDTAARLQHKRHAASAQAV